MVRKKQSVSNGELPEALRVPVEEPSNDNGRHPTLPLLLAAANPEMRRAIKQAGAEEHHKGSGLIEDYNALERLLEPGSPEDLDTRTELNELQIIHFARAEAMAKYYKSAVLTDFVASVKRKQISKGRKGRKEFVSAFQSVNTSEGEAYAMGLKSIGDKLRS